MLFQKYHIVIFRDSDGNSRRFYTRPWIFCVALLIIAALAVSNIYLWNVQHQYASLKHELSTSQTTVHEQKMQLLSLTTKVKSFEKDMLRIRDFDAKLRVMVNLDQEHSTSPLPAGGPGTSDFSMEYLPFHRQEILARKLHNFLNLMNTETRLVEIQQQEIIQVIRANEELWATTPSIWPTKGWVTSHFGTRNDPFTNTRQLHKGLDISAPKGTPIYAPAKGKVTFAGNDGSYGLSVSITHGNGISTRYAHMQGFATKKGQLVERGQVIGYVGNTGRSTGPHLHYEVRLSGVPVNPKRYILN